MRIAIMGTGGVGGYFGGRLAASGAEVSFIARGAHLTALRTHGLRLDSPRGNLVLPRVHATEHPDDIGPVDIVLFTVKMYDVERAALAIVPLVGPDTAVITLQNGVEAVDVVSEVVGRPHVAGGVAYVAAVISEPGIITHTALDALIFGELDGRRSERLVEFHRACAAAGFEATLSERIEVDLWSKFSRLSVFSGMTAVTRSPIGVLRSDPDLLAMLKAACEETIAVGRARGVPLPGVVMDEILKMVHDLPHLAKSSMLEDLERGRRLELPWLSGAVVRLGEESGVATPIHRFIATVLKPYVGGLPERHHDALSTASVQGAAGGPND
ncbi:MAG: 2-dehydropantoate 2-reductase [Vicinamibacterales bacterium]